MTTTQSLPVQPELKPKRFGLSWTQIIAAGFASITATVILSFFSISGTLIGAAVFSMASAVGNAVYGSSLRRTQSKVLDVVPFGKADPASPTVVLPVTEEEDDGAEPVLPVTGPAATGAVLSRRAWKRVAVFALAVFAFVMAVVTSVELIAGRPLTDLLRGEKGSGTSLTGGDGSGGGVSVPTMTVTVTPSITFTTPTITQPGSSTATVTQTPTTTVPPSSDAPTTNAPSTGATNTPTPANTATSGTPSSSRTPSR